VFSLLKKNNPKRRDRKSKIEIYNKPIESEVKTPEKKINET